MRNAKSKIRKQLFALKRQISAPKIIAQKDVLNFWKKLQFMMDFFPPRNWKSMAVNFAVSAGILLAAFSLLGAVEDGRQSKKKILGAATSALQEMDRARGGLLAQDLDSAQTSFAAASLQFESARRELSSGSSAIAKAAAALPPGLVLDEALAAAGRATDALARLALVAATLENTRLSWDVQTNASDLRFYESIKAIRGALLSIKTGLGESLAALSRLQTAFLPADARAVFETGLQDLQNAADLVGKSADTQSLLLALLGGEPKTYLIIFQNNNEARATGGFIGTYGLLQFENGQMRILKIESIYNLDGQQQEQIAAPGPLQRQASPLWGIRDANWFADFPSSARKLLEFLEKTTGVLADGVISFTPDLFEKLVAITGPVAMPEYGETLDAQNFRIASQRLTSEDYDRKQNQPKKFLADFAPRLLLKIGTLDRDQWVGLLASIGSSASEKHILLFSLDRHTQSLIKSLGLTGEVRETEGDYLQIAHSNVGGGKTDLGIRQTVEKLVTVGLDGRAMVTLKISRTHKAYAEKFFPKNLDFMRVFVPAGTRLLTASGFDDYELLPSRGAGAATDPDLAAWDAGFSREDTNGVYTGAESGYTVFAGWLALTPGQTKTVEIRYELPFKIENKYTMLLQKQSGSAPFEFALSLDLPWETAFSYPDQFSGTVSSDQIYAAARQ